MTIELVMDGSIQGHGISHVRLRTNLLNGSTAAPDSVRLDAIGSSGDPLFNFAAVGNDVTLLLPRQNQKLERGYSEVVLQALIGVRLSPSTLRAVLTGCVPGSGPDFRSITQVGTDWQAVPMQNVLPGEVDRVFLHREMAGQWRIVAATHHEGRMDGWRAEYRDFQNGLPRHIRLVSNTHRRFDLRLSLAQVDVDIPFTTDPFHLLIPPSAAAITLGELLESRPLVETPPHVR